LPRLHECVTAHGAGGLGLALYAYNPHMGRPVDAVTSSVLKLQMAQRAVDTLIQELIDRVSVDPFGESSHPDFRLRLSELRSDVDQAADELDDALARMGRPIPEPDSN